MASLFEPDVPEVVSGEDVTQAEQPQQPVSPAINDKKSDSGEMFRQGDRAGAENETGRRDGTATATRSVNPVKWVDMAAYEAWQQENHPDIQQQMQRREEVNITVHRERGEDVEPGEISDEQVNSSLHLRPPTRSNSRALLVTIISPRLRHDLRSFDQMARQGVPEGQVLLLSGWCVWQQQRRNPERQWETNPSITARLRSGIWLFLHHISAPSE